MIEIKNGNIKAYFNELGAELKALKKGDTDYIWQTVPSIWNGSAPLLFPICGGLKDDKYFYEGKEYILPKHGFARKTVFEVENSTENAVTFLTKSNEETKKCYPFDFELRVTYTATENGLTVTYDVNNLTDGDMYFSIGSHEAYDTPEGIEDYDVIFPENETLNTILLDGNLLQKNTAPILKDAKVLPLYDKYFFFDALVFRGLKSKFCTLRNRKTGKFVKIDFPDKPYFLIWHKPAAPYICLEPWAGIPDSQDTTQSLKEKEGIIKLVKGEAYKATHTIEVG